jgi:hypothetical protein
MGPISAATLANKLFLALSEMEDFKYNLDQLNTFHQQIKTPQKTAKARSSAWQAFRSANKGLKEDLPAWEDIKNNPEELAKYQNMADEINNERGFTDEDPKASKKRKSEERKNAIKAAIVAEKQKKNIKITENVDKPEDKSEDKPEEKSEDKPEEKSEDKPEEKSEDKPEEKSEDKSDKTSISFDEIDENNDGVISREEFDKFTRNSDSDNDSEENAEEDIQNDDDKPLYTGKCPNTALSNFKEWVLQEKGLELNSKISRDDQAAYKTEFNFDPKKYDEDCPWFEFIQNNMRIE